MIFFRMKGRYQMAVSGASKRAEIEKRERVLTKALLRSAELLKVGRKELSEIIGISEATISRMHNGESLLSLGTKEGETAAQFVRIYRSLDSLFGGKPELCSKWLQAPNSHLGGTPLRLTKNIQGLIDVARYLDAMRAKI